MMDETGARGQESLRTHPAYREVTTIDRMLRGVIMPNGVHFSDDPKNTTGTTMVDVSLMGGYPDICGVPITHPKINYQTGEEWTPDPGDAVLVAFINGNFWEPVVIGSMPLPNNEIEATRALVPASKRRYHFKCNKTDIIVDKDGNRTTYVNGDDTVTIENDHTMVVETGNATMTVSQGFITVYAKGNVTVNSDANVAITAKGTSTIQSNGSMSISCKGAVSMHSDTAIALSAPRIDLN